MNTSRELKKQLETVFNKRGELRLAEDPLPDLIDSWVKQERERTAQQLAQDIGVSPQLLNDIRRGHRTVTDRVVALLLKQL